jgi:hypothetical protein
MYAHVPPEGENPGFRVQPFCRHLLRDASLTGPSEPHSMLDFIPYVNRWSSRPERIVSLNQ